MNPAKQHPMIKIESGRYARDGFHLGIDISVQPGCFAAVLGPSGSGKSTLLNVIAGFDELASGRVVLADLDVTHSPPSARPVSAVFQDNNSFAHLDAWTNVALGLSPSLSLTNEQQAQIDDALAAVGLSHLARRLPGDMSGGERQRIAIARVLVRKRPILLLDEAFAALGPALLRDMMALVKDLHGARGLTTLMVTHQPEDARGFADQVIFVDGGVVRPPVDTATFFATTDEQVTRYLGGWQ